jgi:cell division protein FtsW
LIGSIRARIGATRLARALGRYLETPYASLQLLLVAGCGLLLFGVMMSASTTISASLHTTGDAIWTQLIRELEFLVMSVPVFWLAVRLRPGAYRVLAYPALALAVLALVAVLVPHIGATINGAHRWILLGPFTVQPSEYAKLAILLWGADLLARKHLMGSLKSARHILVPLVPGFVLVIALIMLQPDLGTTLCFLLLLLGLLWMVGLPYRYFAALLLTVVGAVTVLAVAQPYRLQRLTTFMHPGQEIQSHGFQTIGGLWALSSGGLFGVGLGRGTLKYGWVPNANTDYVFAVVGEELGLLGTTAVLVLFAMFTYAAFRIAFRSPDMFIRLAASGAGIWIAGQALINIGYVTALLPVTGIPLPFISAGGTSLILTCGVFGMLISFARHEPAAIAAAQRAHERDTVPRWLRSLRLGVPRPTVTSRPMTSRPATTRAAATPKAASATAERAARPARSPRPSRPATASTAAAAAALAPTGTESAGTCRSARRTQGR